MKVMSCSESVEEDLVEFDSPASVSEDERACTPKRHSDFWFSDGSVVLLAHDTLFRVHKTFLSRHSLVFRDMFTLPQPSTSASTIVSSEDEIDGCPVVDLHDSPNDVSSLLYALYDGPKFGDNSQEDFRVVSGILRLATKYDIESLRKRALDHLSIAWPSTLKGWDAREEVSGGCSGPCEEKRLYPNPVEVINLAREINASSLLPSAFYDLSRYPLADIFENSHQPMSLHSLSLADTQKLVVGKENAHYAVISLIRSMATEARSNPQFSHTQHAPVHRDLAARHRRGDSGHTNVPPYRCSSPSACWRDVCELVDLATQHYLFDRERGARDPLYVAEELAMLKGAPEPTAGTENGETAAECRACARAFEVWAKKEREKLWRAIPSWFRLDHE